MPCNKPVAPVLSRFTCICLLFVILLLPGLAIADTLTGSVVTPDGTPAKEAAISWFGRVERDMIILASAKADAQGNFRFEKTEELLAKSAYAVLAIEAPGWPIALYRMRKIDDPARITLNPAVELHIAFLDPEGKPARDLPVKVGYLSTKPGSMYISMEWKERFTRKTDADGMLVFPGLPQGAGLQLEVLDERYAQLNYTQRITLGNEPLLKATPIRLQLGASISGKISYDPDGKPAADIHIGAYGEEPTPGSGEAKTNADGHFVITQLVPGNYGISIGLTEAQSKDWTFVSPAIVNVAAGARVEGIDLKLIKGAVISGKMTAEDNGDPLVQVYVEAMAPRTANSLYQGGYAQSGKDGSYLMRVPAGTYSVTAGDQPPPGFLTPAQKARTVTVKDGDTMTVDFKFPRSKVKPIHGCVQGPDGKPVANATVIAAPPEDQQYMEAHEVKTDANGEFTLPAVAVRLLARLGKMGTRSMTACNDGGEVTLKLEENVLATVTGIVTDNAGEPISNARVSLYSASGRFSSSLPGTITDMNGCYTLAELWPGQEYNLQASAEGYGNSWGSNLTPTAGQTLTAEELILHKIDSFIAGRVVDEVGKPLAGISIDGGGNHSPYVRITTDDKGAFRIAGITGDTFNISISAPGWKRQQQELDVNGQTDLVIHMKKAR